MRGSNIQYKQKICMIFQTAFTPTTLEEMESLFTDLQYKICCGNKYKMYNHI